MKTTNLLNVILKDDTTGTGGTSYDNETLMDFLDEIGLSHDTELNKVNSELVANGIIPINESNYDLKENNTQDRLVDLINRLHDENISVSFIEDSNTLEIESDKSYISIEIYDIDNVDLVPIELEERNLSELHIQIENYTIVSPSLNKAYEMIINEIRYNELNGIDCI